MAFREARRNSPARGFLWLAGLVFLVAAGFLVFLLYASLAGPEGIEKTNNWEIDELSIIEWMAKSVEAEEAFKREWRRHPEDANVYDDLEIALKYQRKLTAMDPGDSFGSLGRLRKLIQLLEDTKGKALYTSIRSNGESAAALIARGDSISAIPLLEYALSSQEWINTNLQDSPLVDRGEVTRLRLWLENLQTVDAVANVELLIEEGKISYNARDWASAEALFERALGIQESINLNMPASSHVRWRLVQGLKDYQHRIEAGRMNQRIEDLLSSMEEADQTDRMRRAMNLQALLNEKYASTEFENADRLDSLKHALVSNLSEANAALLLQQSETLSQLLRKRDWPLVRVAILEMEGSIQEFTTRFSRTLLPGRQLKEQSDWLIQIEEQLEWIAGRVDQGLVNHPSLEMRLFHTEVDQQLYKVVMGSNSSRWIGNGLPVDSVSFLDAQSFCQRIGWVLGRPVVLPAVSWFGFLEGNQIRKDGFWFSHNSGFKSQPVGTSEAEDGIYNLFGNLEEWVTDGDEAGDVGLFWGSGADSSAKIEGDPLKIVAENFRSRWAGFRFCVLENESLLSSASP